MSAAGRRRGCEALSELQESIGFDHLSVDTNVCKVSIVGAGMMSASGIAALMFEALYDAKINIQMISTSEIKVSVLIEKGYADQAVQAIHNKFFRLKRQKLQNDHPGREYSVWGWFLCVKYFFFC